MSVEECRERLLREVAEWAGTNPDKVIHDDVMVDIKAAVRDLALEAFDKGAQLATGGDLCDKDCHVCQTIRLERARIAALPAGEGSG